MRHDPNDPNPHNTRWTRRWIRVRGFLWSLFMFLITLAILYAVLFGAVKVIKLAGG